MKSLRTATILTVTFILLAGIVFPTAIWGLGQLLFPYQANGSLIYDSAGHLIGSEIIGQPFVTAKYFHPRPSAAGNGYDAANSGGTNLGPTSSKLFSGTKDDPTTPDVDESFTGVDDLAKAYRQENGLAADAVIPVDAVTRSASGLDPHITPKNAAFQAPRISKERNIDLQKVTNLIQEMTESRFLGLFGEPRVNVLKLNLALDKLNP